MVTLLLAARQDGMALLEPVCQQVLQLGGSPATLVLNQLQLLRRPIEVPTVQAQIVPLTRPPEANCQRYDHLLAEVRMSADEIYQRLQGLKLFGMAALCDELLGHRERPLPPPEQWLTRMIEAEESERQCRSIRYQMGIAKFPLARDLDSFDTSDSPVSPAQLQALDRDGANGCASTAWWIW